MILLFFREIIYTKLGYIPKVRDLLDLGFRGLIRVIRELGLNISDIIFEAYKEGIFISQEKVTWKDFTPYEINFFKKHDINIKNLKSRWEWVNIHPSLIKKFYKEVIIPIKGRIPTISEIKEMGFRSLIYIIYSKFDYLGFINDISNEVYGQDYNFMRNIPIEIIDKIREKTKKLTQNFLEKGQYPRSINYLSGNLGLSWSTFYEHCTSFLIDTYGSKRGLEIFYLMWPSEEKRTQKIGIRAHILINDLLTLFFKDLGDSYLNSLIKYYREPQIYSNGVHPDGLILLFPKISNFLIKRSPFFKSLLKPKFKALIFDFTIDSSSKNYRNKIVKYAKDDLIMVIVSLRDTYLNGIRPIPKDIEYYKDNVKIIDYNFFKEIIGLSENFSDSFDCYIQLIASENLKAIKKIHKLPIKKRFTTSHLKNDVKKYTKQGIREFFNY